MGKRRRPKDRGRRDAIEEGIGAAVLLIGMAAYAVLFCLLVSQGS